MWAFLSDAARRIFIPVVGVCRSIHEMSAKRLTDSCPITDSALDVRDIEGVIWRGEYLSAVPGDEPSSWCLDTPPTNTTDARDPEETYLGAAMHVALRCLGM
ncbi:surface protease GP63 [Trypanosoma cruzi]|nr:surface protease GP63 [Trypanosoma cruzi]